MVLVVWRPCSWVRDVFQRYVNRHHLHYWSQSSGYSWFSLLKIIRWFLVENERARQTFCSRTAVLMVALFSTRSFVSDQFVWICGYLEISCQKCMSLNKKHPNDSRTIERIQLVANGRCRFFSSYLEWISFGQAIGTTSTLRSAASLLQKKQRNQRHWVKEQHGTRVTDFRGEPFDENSHEQIEQHVVAKGHQRNEI